MSKDRSTRVLANQRRCDWAGTAPLYVSYHDNEWGVPVRDDTTLFEFLILEGAQAGLSWLTILRKRAGYRQAFCDFDVARVARFTPRKADALMRDPNIVRNRAKIESAIKNARAFMKVQAEFGTFAAYQWGFVGGQPIQNTYASIEQVPARSSISDKISKDLKLRGCSFVGATTISAHMQATGMVNDHLITCARHREVAAYGERFGKGRRRART